MRNRTQQYGKLQRLAEWVNSHRPALPATVVDDAIRFGIAYTIDQGESGLCHGVETYYTRTMAEARRILGY
jgi:hypothetical protein